MVASLFGVRINFPRFCPNLWLQENIAMNAKKLVLFLFAAAGMVACTRAQTIADWTFETTIPSAAGPYSPEVGAGSASGSHALGTTVYSSPAGNGSSHSFSANMWTTGDYFQ